ncbi:MAG TPA: DUF3572 domain-containing protein [Rhizomicrobium sp.]|jgi:hypothetical protein|nr:DUF3572 domain-containing protein [Rhizomicrobium sp.]
MTRLAITSENAAVLALQSLAFLAGSREAIERFAAATGCDPSDMRIRADEPDFLVSVLDFLLSDETLLVEFSSEFEVDVRAVHMARHVLSEG